MWLANGGWTCKTVELARQVRVTASGPAGWSRTSESGWGMSLPWPVSGNGVPGCTEEGDFPPPGRGVFGEPVF